MVKLLGHTTIIKPCNYIYYKAFTFKIGTVYSYTPVILRLYSASASSNRNFAVPSPGTL